MILLRSYKDIHGLKKNSSKYISLYIKEHIRKLLKKPAKGYVSKTNSSIKTKKRKCVCLQQFITNKEIDK